MIRFNLFTKTFLLILLIIVFFSALIYTFSVPLIKETVYEIEENAGKTILDNVYELVHKISMDLEAYRESAYAAHKRELRNIIEIVESYINDVRADVKSGRLSEKEAKKSILDKLRTFKYGRNDYIWVSDYNSVLISHPDPRLYGRDFSGIRDVRGNLIVPPMVEIARRRGDGFYSYWWRRLGEKEPIEKLSYFKLLPQWKWVVGTGVYVDDIKKEVARRKKKAIEELRGILRHIRIGKTGYMFIFDSKMNMIIHPNRNIEGKNISSLLDPVTGKPIGEELKHAATQKDNKLIYRWDKPSDPGNYIYKKISWVRYFRNLDWYIASSVYLDELGKSAVILKRRILGTTLLILLLSVCLGYIFVRRLVNPLRKLSATALRVQKGDLTAKSDIRGNDEIGVLAGAFNNMIDRLRSHIENLDAKVRERTMELEDANRELKRIDETKSAFISTVSHELRTPLTSVLGFANIIKKRLEEVIFPVIDDGEARVSRAASQVRQNLDIIISEGERLTNLINDVLDIAKIEAGRVEWKDEDVDIAEVFRRAAVTTSSLFQSKGLYLEGEVEGGGLIVRGDRDRMIQVVTNLLSNAVKFTDGGGTITYRIRRNAGYVRSEVEDTGNGIPSDMLERVFEKFRQVGDTLTDRPKGTGLGLPICREIINHHGGRIWAESKEGGGSRFIFELPLKAAGQGGHTEIQREVLLTSIDNHIKGRAQGETVLIVDDDVSIRVLLSQYLQEKGYRAVEAVDGKDAIGKTRAMMPDLILLDIMMPDLSGYDVLRVLKNDDTTREIPVIVISALENRDKGLMLGAADYITKPVDEERLFDSIQRVMNEGQRNNRCRVMIIDRDRESCREIAEAMKGRNFEVIQSCCDTEDIRKGLEATPDIILVDMGLVEDGYINEICREDSIRDLMIKSKILYIVKGSEGR